MGPSTSPLGSPYLTPGSATPNLTPGSATPVSGANSGFSTPTEGAPPSRDSVIAAMEALAQKTTTDGTVPLSAHKVQIGDQAADTTIARTMSKVVKFVLKMASTLFPLGALKEYYTLRKNQHQKAVEAYLNKSIKLTQDMLSHPLRKTDAVGSATMVMPDEGFVDKQDLKKVGKDHEYVAKKAVHESGCVSAAPIHIEGVGTLTGYSFSGGEVKADSVHPTANLQGLSDSPENAVIKEHLVNAYAVITKDGRIIIRSGKIDSEQAAKDFVLLVKAAKEDLLEKHLSDGTPAPEGKLKIISEQVNSYETDGTIIDDQHYWIIKANEALREVAEVVHINVPSNRTYNYTEKFGNVPLIGRKLDGEARSKEQNLESWAAVADWAYEHMGVSDSPDSTAHRGAKNAIDGLVVKIYEATLALKKKDLSSGEKSALKLELKGLNAELSTARGKLRELLVKDYEKFKGLETNPLTSDKQVATLMRMILGSQLDIPGEKMDRGKEGMAMQLLNMKLGIGSAINCKSGLDRSGFWFAARVAMESVEKELGPDRLFKLVQNWDENTRMMNQMAAHLADKKVLLDVWIGTDAIPATASTSGKAATPGKSFAEWELEFPSLVEGKNEQEFQALKREMRDVARLRNHVLENIREFGLKITAISTNVMGMKWNEGLAENLIPLNFLPPHVIKPTETTVKKGKVRSTETTVKKDNVRSIEGNVVLPLVKYSKDGTVQGMSSFGRRLITKFQALRGS